MSDKTDALVAQLLECVAAWRRDGEQRYTDTAGTLYLKKGPNHYKHPELEDEVAALATTAADAGDGEEGFRTWALTATAYGSHMEEVERNHGGFVYYLKSEVDAALSRPAADSEAVAYGHHFRDMSGTPHFWRGPEVPAIAQSQIVPLFTRPSAAAVPEVDDAFTEPRTEKDYGADGRSYRVVFVHYRDRRFVDSIYQYVGGGRRCNTTAFRRKVWPTRNPSKPVRQLLLNLGADLRGEITAALTPAPRRIEREDAPTVDDGKGVG
jgi:hypothetical protein